jgi:hypothetical protein
MIFSLLNFIDLRWHFDADFFIEPFAHIALIRPDIGLWRHAGRLRRLS